MLFCAISTCENSFVEAENVSLHSFPLQNATLLKKWIYGMKFTELKPPVSFYLCSKHFLATCFDARGSLKPDAIPSLDTFDNDNENVESSPGLVDITQKEKKSIVEEHIGAYLCRMCSCKLNANDSANMICVFDDSKRVLEKMKFCLPVLVDDCNDLPRHVCEKCYKQLERMYAIRSLSATTESLLYHYLASIASKDTLHSGRSNFEARHTNKIAEAEVKIENQLPLSGPVACNLCDSKFTDMNRFDEHMNEHDCVETEPTDGLKVVVCSSCGVIFESDSSYQEHKRQQKYECVACDRILLSHCEMKSHLCPVIGHKQEFSRDEILELNGEIQTTFDINSDEIQNGYITEDNNRNKRKKFYCTPCNRQFQRKVNWQKHRVKHEKEDMMEIFECETKNCNQQFNRLRLLNQHRDRAHRSNQNWICGYCGKHTTTKLSLNIHERIHTGVKPFICEWCGNAFRSKANLSQHHAKHTGIRRHACPVCGKKFSRKSFVTTHMRVHTGERPYACDVCDQRFTQVGDMRRHRRRHVSQHVETSDNDHSLYIIQEVVFKEEKDDNAMSHMKVESVTEGADSGHIDVIADTTSGTLHLDGKINLNELRKHFM